MSTEIDIAQAKEAETELLYAVYATLADFLATSQLVTW